MRQRKHPGGNAIVCWMQDGLLGFILATLVATHALGQSAAAPQPYTEVFYPSGQLRIQAYLYQPPGYALRMLEAVFALTQHIAILMNPYKLQPQQRLAVQR